MCFNYTDYSIDGDQVKVISFFCSWFSHSYTNGNGISMTVIHHSTRSGQGEERTVVSKMSNVDRELGQYIHKLTCLLKWI